MTLKVITKHLINHLIIMKHKRGKKGYKVRLNTQCVLLEYFNNSIKYGNFLHLLSGSMEVAWLRHHYAPYWGQSALTFSVCPLASVDLIFHPLYIHHVPLSFTGSVRPRFFAEDQFTAGTVCSRPEQPDGAAFQN